MQCTFNSFVKKTPILKKKKSMKKNEGASADFPNS